MTVSNMSSKPKWPLQGGAVWVIIGILAFIFSLGIIIVFLPWFEILTLMIGCGIGVSYLLDHSEIGIWVGIFAGLIGGAVILHIYTEKYGGILDLIFSTGWGFIAFMACKAMEIGSALSWTLISTIVFFASMAIHVCYRINIVSEKNGAASGQPGKE